MVLRNCETARANMEPRACALPQQFLHAWARVKLRACPSIVALSIASRCQIHLWSAWGLKLSQRVSSTAVEGVELRGPSSAVRAYTATRSQCSWPGRRLSVPVEGPEQRTSGQQQAASPAAVGAAVPSGHCSPRCCPAGPHGPPQDRERK